ncbi:DUF4062 domain-containing protein [Nakamurella silvestris]|nr:DUF4062 domain-containing protein [Nakamurella silvestris]
MANQHRAKTRYQVFLSSTYIDLIDQRLAVTQALVKTDRCIPAGMEIFSASAQPPWAVITSALEGTDYLVLVLGHRYGSTVPGEEISYTEKEYEYALAHDIPVLAFLSTNDHPVAADQQEKPTPKRLLKKFRERVSSEATIEQWSTASELAHKVALAVLKAIDDTPRPGWVRGDATTAHTAQQQGTPPQSPPYALDLTELIKDNDAPLPVSWTAWEQSKGQYRLRNDSTNNGAAAELTGFQDVTPDSDGAAIYSGRFPVKLQAGESVPFRIDKSLVSAAVTEIRVTWNDAAGTEHETTLHV